MAAQQHQQSSDTNKIARPRGKNFDSKENELILDLFSENNELLRSKHNSSVTTQRKNSVLREICEKVNALGVAHRTVSQIKTKWSNMVSDGKAKDAELKRSHGKTGGGPPCTPATATQDKIISLFAETPSFCGISGPLESDIFSEGEHEDSWLEIPGPLADLVPPVPNCTGDAQPVQPSSVSEDPEPQPGTSGGEATVHAKKRENKTKKRPMSVLELQKDVLILQRSNLQLEHELLKLKIKKLKSSMNES